MQNISSPNPQAPVAKEPDKKIIGLILIITCAAVLLVYVIATSFTSKKHTLNQPIQTTKQSSPNTQTQAVAPLPQINTVTLTKSGFTPAKITIRKGTAVKWVNDGLDNVSVNSDDYPTNQRYPELNLGKINKGSAVAHIFNTSGTYTYHNQYNPKQKGTITVE